MKNKIVIGLIGEKGSGKGTISKFLKTHYRADHYVSSDILRDMSKHIHLPETRENLINLAWILKKKFGDTILIDALIQKIENSKKRIVIGDGPRLPEDIIQFRNKFKKNFYLFYVTADIKKRFERIRARKEKAGEGSVTFKRFQKQEKLPTEKNIKKVGKQKADYIIINNGTVKTLHKQVNDIMKTILAKK